MNNFTVILSSTLSPILPVSLWTQFKREEGERPPLLLLLPSSQSVSLFMENVHDNCLISLRYCRSERSVIGSQHHESWQIIDGGLSLMHPDLLTTYR